MPKQNVSLVLTTAVVLLATGLVGPTLLAQCSDNDNDGCFYEVGCGTSLGLR